MILRGLSVAEVSLQASGRASADNGLRVHVGREMVHLSILLVLSKRKSL